MAEQVDGSIVIDTKLDNKGFQKGSDELKSAMTSLTQQLNSIGAKLSGILSAANKQVALLSKAYGDVGDSAKKAGEEAADAMDEAQKSAEKFDPNQVSFTVQRSDGTQARITNDEVIPIEQTEESAERVEDAVDDVNEAVEQSQEKIHAEFEQTAQKAQETAQKTEESAQSAAETAAQSAEQTASQTEQAVEQAAQAAQAAQEDIDHIDFGKPHQAADTFEQNIGDLNRTLNMMGETGKAAAAGDKSAMKEFQAQAKSAQSQIDFLRDELDKFGEAEFETSEHAQLSAQYEKAQAEVDKLSQKLDAAKMKQDALNESFAQSSGVQDIQSRIDEYQGYLDKEKDPGKASSFQSYIDQMKQQIADMQSKFQDSAPYQKTQQDIAAIEQRLEGATQQAEQYKAAMDEVPATFQGSESVEFQKYSDAIDAAESKLAKFETAAAGAGSKADTSGLKEIKRQASGASSAGSLLKSTFDNAFKRINAGAANVAKSLASIAKAKITSGIKGLGTKFEDLSKHAGKSNNALSLGLKKVLAYGFGIRSLFFLFNKLRTALKSGLGQLEKYDSGFASTVNSFKASLTQLRNAFASAFAPILQVALPPLTTLINALSEAVSKVGMLIAALTGKSTFMKASKVQASTAAAANSAAKGLGKEAKAAKAAEKSLAGFDDVEILKKNDTSSGGGGGAADTGGGFEEVPIDNDLGNLADMIKNAWAKADFTEVGRMVGDKLSEALDNIPWGKIKSALQRIARSIATFLNGFLETPGLFTKIGNTIANAINAAVAGAEEFIKNFHWDSLGYAVRDLVNGAIEGIDWGLLEKTARDLGSGIGEAIEAALDNEEIWSNMASAVAHVINMAIYRAQGLLDAIDWASLGRNIGKGLNKGVATIDWEAIGKLIYSGFNSAMNLFYNFITTFNWWQFGWRIGNSLSIVVKNIDWKLFGQSLSGTLNSLMETIEGFVSGVDWDAVGKAIADAIIGFFDGFSWKDFGSTISGTLKALLRTFRSFMHEIPWKTLPAQITKAFKDFLTGFDWKGMVEETVGLLTDALQGLIDMLKGDDETKESPLITALENLKTTVSGITPDIFSNLATGINDIVKALAPVADGFGAGFVNFFNGLVDITIDFFKALGPALSAIADALNKVDPDTLESIGEVLGKIAAAFITINAFKGVLETIKKLTEVIGGLASACNAAAGGITAFLIALDQFKITAGEGEDEAMNLNHSFSAIKDTLQLVQQEYDLTDDQMNTLYETILKSVGNNGSLKDSYGDIDAILEAAGINVDDFKQKLATSAETYRNTGADLSELDGYIASVGENSESADGKTGSLKDAISRFGGVSWSEALKIAVLSGAFKTLSDNGQLSKEDTENLQAALDAYDPSKPEASMKRIYDAFEKSGIKANDFSSAVVGAMADVDDDMKPEIESVEGQIGDMGVYLLTGGKTAGGNIGKGLQEGAKAQEKDTKKAMWTFMTSSLLSLNNAADIGSPSKKTRQTGIYLGQGLINGLKETKDAVTTAANDIVQSILTALGEHGGEFSNKGSEMMTSLGNGLDSEYRYVTGCASDIVDAMEDEFDDSYSDFKVLGGNIGTGIYNGLIAKSGTLNILAWNTAVDMYNSACRALGIHSPSKKFAFIGTMLTAGLAEGVESTEGDATQAVGAMADAVMKTAEDANVLDPITTNIDGFSDKLVDSFSRMVSVMESIANGANFTVPALATGSVTPYASRRAASQSQTEDLSDIASALSQSRSEGITRDQLTEVLSNVLRQYMNFDFYIGDEQIARHANRGNAKLNRRYGTTG